MFSEVNEIIPEIKDIKIIKNGKEFVLSKDKNKLIKEEITNLFETAHTLPAFGVSIDKMFKKEIEQGVYLKLVFGKEIDINGLPFDELVFNVQKDFSGFNLIRGVNNFFEGRCIYVDLVGKTLENLLQKIEEILRNNQ